MKISMLLLSNFTHDARVHKEAKTLAAAGHRVVVYALWKEGLPREEERSGYRIQRVPLHSRRWRGGGIAPLVKYLEFTLRALSLLIRAAPHVVHAHDANTLPLGWLAARRTGARLVYDAHELETGRNFGGTRLSGIYRRLWALPERLFIRRADAVITVCDGIADELVRLYGIPRPVVVMNCPERTARPASSDRLRRTLSIPVHQRIALYQGLVAPGRGLETMAAAVRQLPDVAGVILGDGPALEEYRARAASGEWPRMYLPGKVPLSELPSYTASADVGLSLIQNTCRSYYFALPNKIFEYLQAGIPVIGSDLPEIARVIRTYQVGVVVDPEDPQAVADALRRLLGDPEGYARLRANALRAAAIFTWERESAKLLDLYRRWET
ncbi:MAG TPA: glycosyltransferase WbuB [Chloroflexi bacterium]|nr:glycosyltransferase WbuB [Chloroflexota bacterium]